jgi:hypothetical protein
VAEGFCVYVIELFHIMLPRRIRKELRKCISYRGNSVVSLVNQRINNGMYYRLHQKKITPLYSNMMIRNTKVTWKSQVVTQTLSYYSKPISC